MFRDLVEASRVRWPKVEIVIRDDSHCSRPEVPRWLERNRVGSVFCIAGNRVLLDRVAVSVGDGAVRRAYAS